MSSVTSETSGAQLNAPHAPPAPDMVWIPPGESLIGSDSHYAEERPAHRAHVGGFWVDQLPVTNARFAAFVAATGHVTLAELPPNPADYRGAAPEMLHPGSLAFRKPEPPVPLQDVRNWWELVLGADWRRPYGPASTIDGLADHPVTHVAYADVVAYAAWAGKQIPTEPEWERAARGGLPNALYAWGNEFLPDGRFMANTWQGRFPYENLREDGYERTSPVYAFPPNGYGVHDMIGNVWEWTSHWYAAGHGTRRDACCGAAAEASRDPASPSDPIPRKVLKGGSHLCAPNYCRRYRPAARYPQPIDTSTCHVGFRCIIRPRQDASRASGS
jgi:formylglycine-generating enzyme required for sulfatase activity